MSFFPFPSTFCLDYFLVLLKGQRWTLRLLPVSQLCSFNTLYSWGTLVLAKASRVTIHLTRQSPSSGSYQFPAKLLKAQQLFFFPFLFFSPGSLFIFDFLDSTSLNILPLQLFSIVTFVDGTLQAKHHWITTTRSAISPKVRKKYP